MFCSTTSQPPALRWSRTLLVTVALLILAALAGAPAMAQDSEIPREEGLTSNVRTLSETRSGDRVTVTKEYAPSADTFTTSGQPNTNWRSNQYLRVGYNLTFGYGAERTFIAFRDLTSGPDKVPQNAVIKDARLRMYLAEGTPAGGVIDIQARFLTTAWDPELLTWNSYNPQWGSEIGIAGVGTNPGWVEAAVPGTVSKWVSGQQPNYGVMLQALETPQQRERVFYASNGPNGTYPRLIVTYDVVIDTTPPVTTMNPLPATSPASFKVKWSAVDNEGGTGVKNYDVQYRTQGGNWVNWLNGTTQTEADFSGGANNVVYEFRARATDNAGNVGNYSSSVSTRVDSVPPNATMNALPQYTYESSFQISWVPNEDPANINWYDVQFQVNGGTWQNLLEQTTLGNFMFTGAQNGSTYGFRVRAQDKAGNIQPWSNVAQASTTIVSGKPTAEIVPFSQSISTSKSFSVSWTGTPVSGTTITSYEVQVSVNGGAFTTWNVFPGNTLNGVYNAPSDGIYTFRVRATDNRGQTGEFSDNPGSTKVVDSEAPFITPRLYMPYISR